MSASDKTDAAPSVRPVEVLTGRATSYRMLSRLFFKPLSASEIDELAASDYGAVALSLGGEGLLAEGFNDMGRALRRRHTGTRQQLATDFTMCFDGVETADEQVAVPYASVFLGEKALLNQEPRHEVYRFYRSEAVRLKSGVNLPEDHLSFELEFLAILSDRAAEALGEGGVDEAARCLRQSQEFIRGHVLTWLGLFAERAERILKTRFYRGALKAVRGYLELDLETLGDLLEVLGDGPGDGSADGSGDEPGDG
ncbi:MAG: molecular chaperone TorD family protein [Coriobacteriales bacterium]|jgi:TorA maturation chaperone TorD|nr:molecular chaperone TorD family protein [Coriobacteriales bacterium]